MRSRRCQTAVAFAMVAPYKPHFENSRAQCYCVAMGGDWGNWCCVVVVVVENCRLKSFPDDAMMVARSHTDAPNSLSLLGWCASGCRDHFRFQY